MPKQDTDKFTDPSATEEAEEVLHETFKQQKLHASEFDTVQCQTDMCVVEFIHQQEKNHDILLQKLYTIKLFSRGFLVNNGYFRRATENVRFLSP